MFVSPAEETYRPSVGIRLLFGLILVVLLGIVGALLYANDRGNISNSFWVIVGIATAIYFLIFVLMGKTRLAIHPEGVRYSSLFGAKELLWQEIQETRYQAKPTQAAVGMHFGLLGMLIHELVNRRGDKSSKVSQTLRLIGKDGTKIKVGPNFSKSKEAISLILGKIVPPLVAEMKDRIQSGETIRFGSVSVSLGGVAWKSGKPIAFSEIKTAEIAGRKLRIGKQGKWLNHISVRCEKVPNAVALLAIVKSFMPAKASQQWDPLEYVRA